MLDDELQLAAQMHATAKHSLPAWRKRALGLLRELKRRLEPFTAHLRTFKRRRLPVSQPRETWA